ncbi:YgiT-type zinc finger protein [Leptolyngbya sp. FACHB-261]|uniref:YgiT-type zinc finger protein n=1 Tax=Leptolyngbya sp. FACHB-261 TaxID=2692806 RepID=UPI001685DA8B|nr:YgiT-type zinc finger protein [Leptolyngbya sp. FACHB-261]MBD2104531.1 YgiT-type zinc finger protein [Leptolyngbya sp. FACHB-261]
MSQCDVCGSVEFHEELVSEVFQIDSKPVLVENIPAKVCARCGELVFSRETTERIRRMVHGEVAPERSMSIDVFVY